MISGASSHTSQVFLTTWQRALEADQRKEYHLPDQSLSPRPVELLPIDGLTGNEKKWKILIFPPCFSPKNKDLHPLPRDLSLIALHADENRHFRENPHLHQGLQGISQVLQLTCLPDFMFLTNVQNMVQSRLTGKAIIWGLFNTPVTSLQSIFIGEVSVLLAKAALKAIPKAEDTKGLII